MIWTYGGRIIREKHIDDGTTGGRIIWQTEDGRWWKESNDTKETAPTGVTIGRMENGKIWT